MKNDLEVATVFGLMTFGADAARWDEELFFYRTGIALKLKKEQTKV